LNILSGKLEQDFCVLQMNSGSIPQRQLILPQVLQLFKLAMTGITDHPSQRYPLQLGANQSVDPLN
jgi:hypothetical protein